MNLYAYVGGDPINLVDPSGMACGNGDPPVIPMPGDVVVTASCPNPVPPCIWPYCGAPIFGFPDAPVVFVPPVAGGGNWSGPDLPMSPPQLAQNNHGCPGAGDQAFSNAVDAVADTHAYLMTGTAATLRHSGDQAAARSLSQATRPIGVGLVLVSEGYAAFADHSPGMSWQRSGAIHGAGAAAAIAGAEAGAEAGFVVGELLFPAGGGAVGAVIGAIGGGWLANKGGQAIGGAAATAAGYCH